MAPYAIRDATLDDLPALTDIYHHYVVHTTITFDLYPVSVDDRRSWFEAHAPAGRHRLLVAVADSDACVGYAGTSRWRPKAAYDATVEASVYCHPDHAGRGCGRALYRALFDAVSSEDIEAIVACVSLPNPASVALHERFGFRPLGVFRRVGRKFDQYWDVAWFERPARIQSSPE